MTGFYPDAPGPRMPYDRDGSYGFIFSLETDLRYLTPEEIRRKNDYRAESWATDTGWVGDQADTTTFGVVFPQQRDLTHLYLATHGRFYDVDDTLVVETSVNTTNGQDGTWTPYSDPTWPGWSADRGGFTPAINSNSRPDYRTRFIPVTVSGIKGIRFICGPWGNANRLAVHTLHLYGVVTAGQTPHRLRMWHPTLDQALDLTPAHLDFGDVARGSTETRAFRIKNLSPTKTAIDTVISTEAIQDPVPSLVPYYELSSDGVNFTPSLTISNLAPNALTGEISLRRTTPVDAALGVWAPRLVAVPTSMT